MYIKLKQASDLVKYKTGEHSSGGFNYSNYTSPLKLSESAIEALVSKFLQGKVVEDNAYELNVWRLDVAEKERMSFRLPLWMVEETWTDEDKFEREHPEVFV